MSSLRIFSYLPNPRIWKATIAGRLAGVEIEVRGAPPTELQCRRELKGKFENNLGKEPRR